jgi:hypothetical protein
VHRPPGQTRDNVELIERDQPLMVRRDQVIQHFRFEFSGSPDTLGKHLPIVLEPFGNVSRTRPHRFPQLVRAAVMALEVRRQQKQVDAQVEQVRELPGSEIAEIGGSRHAGARCNRAAAGIREESRGFHDRRPSGDGESATRQGPRRRNSFNALW